MNTIRRHIQDYIVSKHQYLFRKFLNDFSLIQVKHYIKHKHARGAKIIQRASI